MGKKLTEKLEDLSSPVQKIRQAPGQKEKDGPLALQSDILKRSANLSPRVSRVG